VPGILRLGVDALLTIKEGEEGINGKDKVRGVKA